MHTVYTYGGLNFLYTALVYDVNSIASDRFDDYNLHWLPTCYFDGGYILHDGMSTSAITQRVQISAAREVPALDLTVSMTWLGNSTVEVTVSITNNNFVNSAPDTPAAPTGPTVSVGCESNQFEATGTDPDANQLHYRWDCSDGPVSEWDGPYASGDPVTLDHIWTTAGDYSVLVQTKDEYDAESGWSPVANINIKQRGDANTDGGVNLGDAGFVINYIFYAGPAPDPILAGDANMDGSVNLGDAGYIINYIFYSGSAPGCE